MMDNMRGQMGPTEEEIRVLLQKLKDAENPVGAVGDVRELPVIEPQIPPTQQLPPQPPLPPQQGLPPQQTNREFDLPPPDLVNDGTDFVSPDIGNMSPEIYPTAGVLGEAESVGADETHTMPDGTVHPYKTHEEMVAALLKKQEKATQIEGVELVGADLRGTRLGRGRY
jgi:hypothetical protein